jgi:P-type Cu+ transporter
LAARCAEENWIMNDNIFRAIWIGLLALLALLGVYFGLLTLVSGWQFTLDQFALYWPYISALAAGFGVQVGLYVYLRRLLHGSKAHGKVVAVSGTTSAAAMVSCCTHYLANLLPIVGAAGLVTLATQYQVELFWVGLVFNAAGIAYIGIKVAGATKEHMSCTAPA